MLIDKEVELLADVLEAGFVTATWGAFQCINSGPAERGRLTAGRSSVRSGEKPLIGGLYIVVNGSVQTTDLLEWTAYPGREAVKSLKEVWA